MKNLLLIIGLLLTTNSYCALDTIKLFSKISKVTVFFSGAQVSRQAPLSLNTGKYLLEFKELPKEINPQSIQVKGLKGVKILSVKHKLDQPNPNIKTAEEKEIDEEIEEIKDRKAALMEEFQVYKIEEQILLDNSKIYRGTEGTTVEQIRATADFYRNRLNEIRKGKLQLNIKQKGLKKEMEALYKRLNEITAKKRKTYSSVQVFVELKEKPSHPLTFSYYITSAGWVPTYDFRVQDITKPLNLVYRANVFQSSGEDWTQVDVILSSNNPMLSGEKPQMGNLYLNNNYRYSYTDYSAGGTAAIRGQILDENNGEPLPFCNVSVLQNGKQILGTTSDFNGEYTLKPVPPGVYDVQYSYVGYQTKEVHGITAQANRILDLNSELEQGASLSSVEVMAYSKPLYEKDQTSSGATYTREDIQPMAVRSVADISSATGNRIYSRDNRSSVRGQRTGSSVVFIDGVKLSTLPMLPSSALEEVSVNTGGVSAQYGGFGDNWSVPTHNKVGNGFTKGNSNSPSTQSQAFKKQITHLEYEIAIPYTIPSDGEDYSIQIKEENLAVEYIYYAVPKLDKDAFLTAKINNWNELNLLSGKTSIYYEGTFTGESYLNAQQADDTISVSLGRDKGIFLSRKGDKQIYDKSNIGRNMKETIGWEIVVRNNKTVPITIIVEDQYPLSHRKSVEVALLESSDATIDDKSGKLSWELKVAPYSKKELPFSYSVTYPKYSNIVLQ